MSKTEHKQRFRIPEENKVAPSANRVLLCSGGFDSTTLLVEMLWRAGHVRKQPTVLYLDTTIGAPANRCYVEALCDMYHVPLMTLRTPENIEDITADHGLYGPSKHGDIFQKLKGRQIDHVARRFESSHWFWAVREAESDKRAEKIQREYGDSTKKYDEERSLQNDERDVWHHAPYRHLSDAEIFERAKALRIPPNPLWFKETPSDCGCGATAKFWEREEARQAGLNWLVEKIDELEDIARENGHTGGQRRWGEMKAQYKRALNDGQQTLGGDDVERTDLASMACGIGTDCQKSSVPVASAEEYVEEVFA